MTNGLRKIELLAPAKNLECGIAAIDHGADAVYIGAAQFGARQTAGNSTEDIAELTRYAHQFGAAVYVTVNTIVYEKELHALEHLLRQLVEMGVDAILVQDMAVLEIYKKLKAEYMKRGYRMPALHASTQTDNRSADKVKWLEENGFERVVLAREYIYHNAFIDACGCTCCGHVDAILGAQSLGWFDNLSITGKTNQVPWSHLIYDPRYSDIVDIYEGGYMHSRGVFRSEQNSCMNNDIPYYSTISRESIVKRIKRYAGEEYSFEEFVANDKRDVNIMATRSIGTYSGSLVHSRQLPPTIHKGSPIKKLKK